MRDVTRRVTRDAKAGFPDDMSEIRIIFLIYRKTMHTNHSTAKHIILS
jgi:hypothetical protein